MIAIVRIRGRINVNEQIVRTLNQLHLPTRNSCTIIPENDYYKGMLQKVKDYVTWGPLDKKGLEALIPRIEATDEKIKIDPKAIMDGKTLKELKLKPRIRLHPARGGLKAVTRHYPEGDLGNRGEEINNLLVKMR